MTQTLKKQLLLLAVGALIIGGSAGATFAQQTPFDFLGVFGRARENARRSSCQSNLKQIGLGIAQYSQDYDEKLPPARDWTDVLQPYLKSEQIFNCPSLPSGKKYGYALNAKIARQELRFFTQPSVTVAVYETQILKRNAFGFGEFRANRHLGGANFAFVDGHVKWLLKDKMPSFKIKP